jgi:hypothetical protein
VTTIQDAITRWKTLWPLGCRVFNLFAAGDARKREALELVLAALLYERWALDRFDEGAFHDRIRDNPMTMAHLAAGAADPSTDRHHVGATMHLASASIRLPAALHQVAKILGRGNDFGDLYGPADWQRDPACGYLDEVRQLGHCSRGLTISLALVLLMLFRDEFGHGEEGSGKGHWRRDRETTMTGLHRCRVVEAQQMLAQWAFENMDG